MTYELRSHTITFEAALRDLASKSDKTRALAAHALGDVVEPHDRARAVPALIRALGDARPEVRAEAALSLGDLETEAAVEPLIERMEDGVPVVRQAAAMALGKLGFASAFDAMARALAKGPPDLRFQAATSLAEIDSGRAGTHLLEALEDTDGEVVAAAALALGATGYKEAQGTLARLLDAWSSPRTRFDIAYGLADLGDDRGLDVLVGFVDHKELGWDAIDAIERTRAPRAARALAPLLGRRLLNPALKLRAAAAVLELGGPDDPAGDEARAVLLAGLHNRKLEHRGLAVQLLERVGGPWAVPALEILRSRRGGKRLIEEIDAALAHIMDRDRAGTTP